jgi:hypothetical protein
MTKTRGKGNSLAKILIPSVTQRKFAVACAKSSSPSPWYDLTPEPTYLNVPPFRLSSIHRGSRKSSTVRSIRADQVDSQICLSLAVTLSPLRFPKRILEVDHRRIRKKVLRTRLHLLSCRPRPHLLCIHIVHFFLDIRQWLALVAGSVLGLLCIKSLCNSCTSRA